MIRVLRWVHYLSYPVLKHVLFQLCGAYSYLNVCVIKMTKLSDTQQTREQLVFQPHRCVYWAHLFFLLFILYVVGFRTYSHQLSELYNALDTTRNHKHAQALHDLPAVTRNVRHDRKMRDCCHNKQRTFYLKTDQQRSICSWQERPVPQWECLVSQLCKMGLIKAGGGCAQEICWIQEMERTTVAIYVFAHGCRH